MFYSTNLLNQKYFLSSFLFILRLKKASDRLSKNRKWIIISLLRITQQKKNWFFFSLILLLQIHAYRNTLWFFLILWFFMEPFFNSIFWRVNVCSDAYIMRKKRFDKIFILQIYKAIQFVYFTSYMSMIFVPSWYIRISYPA